jgi:hypothetical protein
MMDKIYFIADKNKNEALLPLKPFFSLDSVKNTIKWMEKSRDIRKKSGLPYIDKKYTIWEVDINAHGTDKAS